MHSITVPLLSRQGGGTHQLVQISEIEDRLNFRYIYIRENPIAFLKSLFFCELHLVSCPFVCILYVIFQKLFQRKIKIIRIVQADDFAVINNKVRFFRGFLYWFSYRLKVDSLVCIESIAEKIPLNMQAEISRLITPFPPANVNKRNKSNDGRAGIGVLFRGQLKSFDAFVSALSYLQKDIGEIKIYCFPGWCLPDDLEFKHTVVYGENRDDFLKWLGSIETFVNTSAVDAVSFLNIEALDSGCKLICRNMTEYTYLNKSLAAFFDTPQDLALLLSESESRTHDENLWNSTRERYFATYAGIVKQIFNRYVS